MDQRPRATSFLKANDEPWVKLPQGVMLSKHSEPMPPSRKTGQKLFLRVVHTITF